MDADNQKYHPRQSVFTCSHVLSNKFPILLAQRDLPLDEADSGWQILCGANQEDDSTGRIIAVEEAYKIDQAFEMLFQNPPQKCFARHSPNHPWEEIPYTSDEENA